MIAYTQMPGGSYFKYFRGTKPECTDWLDRELLLLRNRGLFVGGRIIPDKVARKVRWQDGRHVFHYWRYPIADECKPDVQSWIGVNHDQQQA